MLLAKELHKPVRIHFKKSPIIAKGIDDLWAADLIDMKTYSGENIGYSYLLHVIDTFSKFAWALQSKGKTVLQSQKLSKK
jgi:hypothetical protein